MNHILFIDIETDRKGRIVDYGAIFNGQELHEKHSSKLEAWLHDAKVICGHNILAHDIPLLKKQFGDELFINKRFIDTLLWSPLLFTENPYHKLVKGYKIVNEEEANNPLSDCKLTLELLLDELNAFDQLDIRLKRSIYYLLKDQESFKEFFSLFESLEPSNSIAADFSSLLERRVCNAHKVLEVAEQHPVELAYALALLRLDSETSILPYWVSKQYPVCEKLIEQLRFKTCRSETCTYCRSNLDPKTALLNYFGYPDFRKFDVSRPISLQEETVNAGLQNHSFVAVFPTGGGKSLTFQLPALMRGDCTRHLTIVISPLVSLMKDQVDNLQDRFQVTKAVAINGLLSPLERQEALERVEHGGAHLLYISPESLRSPTIFRLISSRTIARFVIDEAHCFSSWGQDFRVDYLYIATFIKELQKEKGIPSIPVSCFTATAKPQVIEDIKDYFKDNLNLELKEFVTNVGRTNLSYEVIEIENPSNKTPRLLELLKQCEKPAIIYASRTKMVEQICAQINETSLNSTFFHGQLEKDKKKENMDAFMSGDTDLIVATSAFGMGVDKEDVRTVIHYNISDSLENYVQEAGRAGRKASIQAKCYILYSEDDLGKHFSLLQRTKINKKEIEEIWRSLKNLSKSRTKISQSALEIAKSAGWDTDMRELETRVTTAISALENEGFLDRRQNSPRVFADSLLVPTFSRGKQLIEENKHISDSEKQDCTRILKRIITDKEVRVDYLADLTDLSISKVQSTIQVLRDLKILGDSKDLTAFINTKRSAKNSRSIVLRFVKLEKVLAELLSKKNEIKIAIRQLNQVVLDQEEIESSSEMLLKILNYWEIRKFISKKRIDSENQIYEINIKKGEELLADLEWRHNLVGVTVELLEQLNSKQNQSNASKEDLPVSFSLIELRDSNTLFGQIQEPNTRRYELTLLFMNQIKAIKLEGGFMVSYNKLNIENIQSKEKSRFTNVDYQKMATHYEHKTQQIHIVGEYARKSIENYEASLAYVNDYFSLDYEEFLLRYFPNRKTEMKRPLTPQRFQEIIKELDIDQTQILSDNTSSQILVLAGPGSGKTRVLVHKIASLLLLEDIKPEQFLMLTFSKAAAMEFRTRMRKLVPEFAGLVKITTFHSFCFELMGQLGDLVKSKNIISDCLQSLTNDELDPSMITNKGVLLLDEVQDINAEEWALIQKIVELANNMRVIAVGDDDQNIYSFRGSSNQYMGEYKRLYNAKEYNLIRNYRSRKGIIDFNNHLLLLLSNRLKTQPLIPAQTTKRANIKVVNYTNKHLIAPLAKALVASELEGRFAVLVRTNEEVLLVSSILKQLGRKTRLLAGFEGFSIANLSEVRTFSSSLKSKVHGSGLILETSWHECFREFQETFRNTPHFQVCRDLINKFDQAYPDRKLLVDWWEYIRGIQMEDAIHADSNSIIVSTMHKAKGKEFDHVWLLLEDYEINTDESIRLLYVACSRAKQSLEIHTNGTLFNQFKKDEIVFEDYTLETFPPQHYEMILGIKDINLGSQKYVRASERIAYLKTGDVLYKDQVQFQTGHALGLSNNHGRNVLLYSKRFIQQKYNPFIAKGYELVYANVEYIVYWYDTEENKEYRILLPRLRFDKKPVN